MIRIGVDVGGTFTDILLEQTQGEHRLADQHRQGLAPPGAAAHDLQGFAGDETEFAQAAQQGLVGVRRGGDDAAHRRMGAVGQVAKQGLLHEGRAR